MIKRSTWLILVVFLAAVGTLLFLKYRPTLKTEATPSAIVLSENYLFSEEDGSLVRFRISDKQYNIMMMERPDGGLWTVTLPIAGPADLASAEAADTQIMSLMIVDTIKNPHPLSALGLSFPSYVLKLTFTNNIEHQMEIGNKTPTGSGYYVRLDAEAVYIINADGIDALINLLNNPPYLPPTSTPVPPTPASTDVPTSTSEQQPTPTP
jgi:hypothetical protein